MKIFRILFLLVTLKCAAGVDQSNLRDGLLGDLGDLLTTLTGILTPAPTKPPVTQPPVTKPPTQPPATIPPAPPPPPSSGSTDITGLTDLCTQIGSNLNSATATMNTATKPLTNLQASFKSRCIKYDPVNTLTNLNLLKTVVDDTTDTLNDATNLVGNIITDLNSILLSLISIVIETQLTVNIGFVQSSIDAANSCLSDANQTLVGLVLGITMSVVVDTAYIAEEVNYINGNLNDAYGFINNATLNLNSVSVSLLGIVIL